MSRIIPQVLFPKLSKTDRTIAWPFSCIDWSVKTPWFFFTFSSLCFGDINPRLTRKLREGNGTPLQYSCLENPMDLRAWWATVHEVAKSRTQLSDFTFPFHFHALEKEMATHSSVLAWRIPGMVEPGGLPSMGSHRVRHDWRNLAAAATRKLERSKWYGPFTSGNSYAKQTVN